eukprot:8863314-Pyramimonas_sp.AAC.1
MLPLHPSPSAHPCPLSLAAPPSQSVDMAFQGPCILTARLRCTGRLYSRILLLRPCCSVAICPFSSVSSSFKQWRSVLARL